MLCPLCGGAMKRAFIAHGYAVLDCSVCGHRAADVPPWPDHVERVYGDAYFTEGGAGYHDYASEAPLLREAGRRYARLLARWREPGDLLDVGAAAGYVAQGFADEGWRVECVEPNPTMADMARRLLGRPVHAGAVEAFLARSRGEAPRFDAVTVIQVIAHLKDPAGALADAARLLRPGGLLLVETWDRASWTARIFGRRWHEYSPPSVLHWFTRDRLGGLGRQAGLEPVASGVARKFLNPRHAASVLRHALGDTPAGRALAAAIDRIPDRLRIPYPGDDAFWMLFRSP